MDEHIYSLSIKLQESLTNCESSKRLNELEKELNDSFEVYTLCKKKDECLEKYTRLKDTLGENHEDTIKAIKELQKAKEELNNHPLVKEYLETYSKVRDTYLEVDDILFSDFRREK